MLYGHDDDATLVLGLCTTNAAVGTLECDGLIMAAGGSCFESYIVININLLLLNQY
jgi:hypothetical protein